MAAAVCEFGRCYALHAGHAVTGALTVESSLYALLCTTHDAHNPYELVTAVCSIWSAADDRLHARL